MVAHVEGEEHPDMHPRKSERCETARGGVRCEHEPESVALRDDGRGGQEPAQLWQLT